ncbi:MAG: diaminopimelate epimerase [Ignavibacteriae bacterium]|nr:MAG: diaminopimelate epimerase [Ignavibacteriota bacterium]
MQNINFTKMNGAGNDFILVDSIRGDDIKFDSKLITQMCDRRKGIGADGILHLIKSDVTDFELIYYNSDGTIGTLCGNGARCSIKYAIENILDNKTKTKFLCNNEIYSGSKAENLFFTFNLNEPTDLKQNIEIEYKEEKLTCDFINTGSPHAIFIWNEFQDSKKISFNEFDIFSFGKEIRHSEVFAPKGTNVNLITIEDEKNYIRTYERGVENETLACGTGTVAAAIILNTKEKIELPIEFITYGGDKLIVNFQENNGGKTKITLTGPAKINYIGSYNF